MNSYCQTCPYYFDCFPEKEHEDRRCKSFVLCTQAQVSECEAHLFCEATNRLILELKKVKNIYELKLIIELISCLFTSSATKEESLSKIIDSSKETIVNEKKDCDPCND